MKRSAFTLVELVVVLAILALMAHLALAATNSVLKRKHAQSAAAQMAEIEKAVKNFRRDTGRLPRGVKDADGRITLSELWQKPDDLPEWRIASAAKGNLCTSETELEDPSVLVPCGWHGPYLTLPANADTLRDGWGNAFANSDEAGCDRLFSSSGAAAGHGEEIAVIRHYGQDATPDAKRAPESPFDRDGEISFVRKPGAALYATFALYDGKTLSAPDGREITLKWYAPCGGAVTGGVAKTFSETMQLSGIPPGECAIRVSAAFKTNAVERIEIPYDAPAMVEFNIRM